MKIGITCYNGKMGKALIEVIKPHSKAKISAALVQKLIGSNEDILLTNEIKKLCKHSELIIDFSSLQIISTLVKNAVKFKIPVVSGTTGLSEKEFKSLEKASKNIPILYSQNMSLGINLIKKYIIDIVKLLQNDFDVEIIETHHRNKLDTPSGTALMLAEAITKKENIVMRTASNNNKGSNQEVGISSIRAGSIFGTHKVIFASQDEVITFTHQALNRTLFAKGAIKAALWLKNQKPGLYSMSDIV